jgi:hypothetical protein
MSVFRCSKCFELIDDDYEGCEEHPTIKTDCVCTDCYNELTDKDEE